MTAIEPVPFDLDRVEQQLAAIRSSINMDWLLDLRANLHAAREWAKLRGRLAQVRHELFVIEVETMARIANLDVTVLPTAHRRAAQAFAAMTESERTEFCARSAKFATPVSAFNALRKEQEAEGRREHGRQSIGDLPPAGEPPANIGALADALLDGFAEQGEPFTIEDFVDALLSSSERWKEIETYLDDPDFRQGVAEMCRKTIASTSITYLDGTVMPSALTVQAGSQWFRIPTLKATVGQARQTLNQRSKQVEELAAARDKLAEFVDKLDKASDGDDTQRIGDIVKAHASSRQ